MERKAELKKAFGIGFVCIFTYFLSYYMRNILTVETPYIAAEGGRLTKTVLASFMSVYMTVYAVGQLINGVIGDKLKTKYMALMGFSFSAVGMLMFSHINILALQYISFALIGLGFSMLRGPLVKLIAENTLPEYARICCVFFSFICYLGPMVASVLALLMKWRALYTFSGILSFVVGIVLFTVLHILEKKKIIKQTAVKESNTKGGKGILSVFYVDKFVVYMFIGMIAEICGTAVSFWIPMYMEEYLGFTKSVSGFIYSGLSLVRSVAPFFTLFLFKLAKENDMKLERVLYTLSAVCFMGMLFTKDIKALNIGLFVLALISAGCASAVMWSIYIPSLARTGRVSSANGILDCSGYFAASVFNMIFAAVMSSFGWKAMIIIWGLVMIPGVAITFVGAKEKQPTEVTVD